MKNVRKLIRRTVRQVPQTLHLALATVLCIAGCRTAPPAVAPADHPQLAPGVRMQDVVFHSAALNRQMPYRVFLPANIETGRTLPAVYLLHGSGGSYLNWSNDSDVSKYAALTPSGGAVLVMPQGGSSYWANAALKPEDKYEDYLTHDLIADVEARFPVNPSRQSRAIVGVSMGGYAAVKLALTRPDLFAFAGAISPAIDVPSRRFTLRRWSQYWRFRSIFGPWGSPTRKAADPFMLVQSASPSATPYLYITAGQQEPLADPITRFAQRLHKHGFPYQFQIKPGAHDWTQWNEQIPGCFESLIQHLNHARDAQSTPHSQADELAAAARRLMEQDDLIGFKALETKALSVSDADAARQDNRLILHLKPGTSKIYDDKPECKISAKESQCQMYKLVAHDAARGIFILAKLYYESVEFLLVDDETGAETTLRSFPAFSPSGRHLLVLLMNDEDVGFEVQIWRRDGHKFVLEWSGAPHADGNYTSYKLERWPAEDTIDLNSETTFDPPMPNTKRRFQLHQGAGIWRVIEAPQSASPGPVGTNRR